MIVDNLKHDEEELKEGYGTNRGEEDVNMLSGNRTGEMQGVGLLDDQGGVTSSGYKTKEMDKAVTVHSNKNFRVIEDA
jgi:hypothetical protein